MDCLEETTVTLFLDRRLPEAQATDVEGHIDSCNACRRLLSELARTKPEPLTDGSEMPAIGDRVDRYVLLRMIGAGGMGTVYAAHDRVLDRKVAVKLLHVDSTGDVEHRTRLLREAQAMARVSSPNVVAVFDAGSFRDQVYVAMELVGGGTLRAWLAEQPRSWREIVRVFVDAGHGLAAAHARGLVHRDFKPENVLIDGDRVCVADFGLASAIEGEARVAEMAAATPSSLERPLTVTGAIVGTPAYMAPEQFAGDAVDARSDQFSFCVALFEALHGVRPFAGDTLDELARELREGEVRSASSDAPAALRAATLRGLARDPEARHASMEALLGKLVQASARPRWPWAAAGVAAAAIGIAGVAVYRTHAADPCAGLAIEAPYDTAAIRAAFARAPDAADRVIAMLDAWRGTAGELRVEACRAAHGDTDDVAAAQLYDLRVACVEDSQRKVGALGAALTHPTPELVEGAVAATERTTDLTLCRSRRSALEPLRPPDDPVKRVVFEQLRAQLAASSTDLDAGRLGAAIEMATRTAVDASAIRQPAIEAEAWATVGRAEAAKQQALRARDAMLKAIVAAEASGEDTLRARLYLQLATVDGGLDNHDADRWVAQARALLDRIGDERLRWEVFAAEGQSLFRAGDVTKGIEKIRAAIHAHGDDADDLDAADLLDILGTALARQGDYAGGAKMIERSLAIRGRMYGERSPALIDSLDALGQILLRMGRNDDAIKYGQRAFDIAEANRARGAAVLPSVAMNLGFALMIVHRNAEALALLDRALVAVKSAFGVETTSYAQVLDLHASVLTDLNRLPEALAESQTALEITRRKLGPDAAEVAQALQFLGRAQFASKRFEDAIVSYRESLRIHAPLPDVDMYEDEVWLGESTLRAKRPADALPHLEKALALRGADTQHDPTERARAQSGIGRALVALGRDRTRAEQLLREARTVFAASEHDSAEQLDEVDAALRQLAR